MLRGASRPDLLAHLDAWLAEAAADERADERRRIANLRHQAEEDASLLDVLVDLGESGAPVMLGDTSGAEHRGRVVVVGSDVVVLAGASHTVVVSLAAVAAITAEGSVATDSRAVATTADLHIVCTVLADDRPRVRAVPVGGLAVTGELRGVGRDALRIVTHRSGRPPATAWVPLERLAHVALLG